MGEGLPQGQGDEARAAWRAFFDRYETIVLVANSDAVRIDELRAAYGGRALFVFFNKVYKVLTAPFEGECVLVARSSPAGANIVYRREVDDVLSLVRSPTFHGIVNLRAGSQERFSSFEEFGGRTQIGHLDLAPTMADFYPSSQVATSGFALALFLADLGLSSRIVLAGFTARRSKRWKLFADHDWTFEQIVQRLLIRAGRLQAAGPVPDDLFQNVTQRFPELTSGDVAVVASEVLAERLDGTNSAIDDLLRITRPQRRLGDWVRSFKPKTRKAKLAERETGKGRG